MTLAEAKSLLSPALSWRFDEDDPVADRSSLERLGRWCQRFSPVVGMEESSRPESLLLDITGCSHLWGGEEKLARAMIAALASCHLEGRIGIADTVGGAWALAHGGDSPIAIASSQSRMAASLEPLSIHLLRLPDAVISLLHELGVRRIGDLESLPRGSIASRFDELLLDRLDQAMGRSKEVIRTLEAPLDIHAIRSLEYPLTQREWLLAIVRDLFDEVLQQLPSGHGLVELTIQFVHERPMPATVVPVGFCRPTAHRPHVLKLVALAMERSQLAAPVIEVHAQTSWSAPLEMTSADLFDHGPLEADAHEWFLLLDRLSSRLGRDHVLQVHLTSDAQPEMACRYRPVSDRPVNLPQRKSRTTRAVNSKTLPESSLRRPLTLYDPPSRLGVRVLQPHGEPVALTRSRKEERIAYRWGPERIQTGWWRGRAIYRDYYRVELEQGHRLWIFHDRTLDAWFLHGAFE